MGTGGGQGVSLELSVAGEPMVMDEPTELPPLPPWMPDLRGAGVVAARPFVMDMQGAIGFEFALNDAPWLSLAFGALVLFDQYSYVTLPTACRLLYAGLLHADYSMLPTL